MGAYDGAQTHDCLITNQTLYPLDQTSSLPWFYFGICSTFKLQQYTKNIIRYLKLRLLEMLFVLNCMKLRLLEMLFVLNCML